MWGYQDFQYTKTSKKFTLNFYSFKRQGAIPGEFMTGDTETGVTSIAVIFKSVLDVRQKVRSGNLKGAYTCKAL